MKASGAKLSLQTLLLVRIHDYISWIQWANTEGAQNGSTKAAQILPKLLGMEDGEEFVTFDTPDDFQREYQRLLQNAKRKEE